MRMGHHKTGLDDVEVKNKLPLPNSRYLIKHKNNFTVIFQALNNS
jgi:hypothetical protein